MLMLFIFTVLEVRTKPLLNSITSLVLLGLELYQTTRLLNKLLSQDAKKERTNWFP